MTRLRRAPDLAAFRARPAGSFLAGRSWIYFCAHAELFGIVFFGAPLRADVEELVDALRVELDDGIRPHRSLVDASRIERADSGAFEALNAYVARHHRALGERVTRLALVRPGGMAGAVVAGFYEVLERPYPVELFEKPRAALAWLGESSPSLARVLEEIATEMAGAPPVVAALRAVFAKDPSASIAEAARALGLSSRTLQRRLRGASTTFRRELFISRLQDAQRRMVESDDALTAIALDLGFSSLQHFSSLFRKATGRAPSAWRAAARRR